MINRIKKLHENVSNKIAAGEVVERPASVVKELIENSIDAKATSITIEIMEAGKSYIRISDNGIGILADDIDLAFERHATSKIFTDIDIYNVKSLGFRGEALASIASVSNVEIITKTKEAEFGLRVDIKNGRIIDKSQVGCPKGTTIIIKDLFYNTPARYKFLKSNSAETNYISSIVNKLALSRSEISFKYIVNNKNIFTTPGEEDIYSTIYTIYGKDIAKNLLKIKDSKDKISVDGYISNLKYTRGNRQLQVIFVNGRYIKSKAISDAINIAYKTLLPINRFPICFLYIQVPYDSLDVNIHPAKTEIRFHDERLVKNFISQVINKGLLTSNLIPEVKVKEKNNTDSKVNGLANRTSTNSDNKNIFVKDNSEQIHFSKTIDKRNNDARDDRHAIKKEDNIKTDKSNEEFQINEILQDMNKTKIMNKDEKKENIRDKSELFDELNIIGQLFYTYIICEKGEDMFLIDQHAAHERILYEKYLDSFLNSEVISQILLDPIVLDLNYLDKEMLMQYKNIFSRLGYKIDEFGYNTIILREVPILFGKPVAKDFFLKLVEGMEKDISNNYEMKLEKIIQQSCKSAIKAYDSLKNVEIKKLLKDLKDVKNPFTCPHGRPIIISITKSEIEKKFMRT